MRSAFFLPWRPCGHRSHRANSDLTGRLLFTVLPGPGGRLGESGARRSTVVVVTAAAKLGFGCWARLLGTQRQNPSSVSDDLRPRLWDVGVAGTEAASAHRRKPKSAPRLLIGQKPGQSRCRGGTKQLLAVCCDDQSEPSLGLALALSQGSLENRRRHCSSVSRLRGFKPSFGQRLSSGLAGIGQTHAQ